MGGGDEMEALVDEIIKRCPGEVEKYKAGKVQLIGFFIGQLMKASKGRADQKTARELIQKKLEA
ncbi:MAG: Asp-tRNA(Asn)/Glu-tRNA(Gln) amidotransferase GatCAB subunit B, partial [Candidatus Marinimicrobia bacterium]|nr:Asp-tRNA(Asn)/Glu-tRNA(Gln) amidotransferase GatCAB subunit B [Candidatus Neomarinimicrobiota bacterium]